MSDIFSEVDEDVRRERALKLWNKYGNYVVVLAVLVVAGTAAFVWWRDYNDKRAETATVQYIAALDQAVSSDPATADRVLGSLAREAPSGYAALARFQGAAIKSRAGDLAGAAAAYRAIASDSSLDRELRDAATVLAALNGAEVSPSPEVEQSLTALTSPSSVWRHLAWELQAIVALKDGRLAEARDRYRQIADDPDAPTGARARAAEMLAALPG